VNLLTEELSQEFLDRLMAEAGAPAPQEVVTTAKPVEFAPVAPTQEEEPAANLDLLLDVTLGITVELGRARMPIRDVLALKRGYVIPLDRMAGEPVDVLINGTLIARGEVVVVDEKFGVRITSIVSPTQRIESLRSRP
jgi:flagellar motor switch protein FliN/FliY